MGNMQRQKGKRGERQVVALAQEMGLSAKRTWETAQSDDIKIRACDVTIAGQPFQVKWQKDGFSQLYSALENVAGVFIRQNGKEWLVVLDAQTFLSYLKTALGA